MQNIMDLLSMHGYAAYVWSSFFVTAVVMLGMVGISLHSLKKARKALADLQDSSQNEA